MNVARLLVQVFLFFCLGFEATAAAVVSESFTGGATGSDLTTHIGEIGAGWTKLVAGGTGNVALTGTGSVFGTGASVFLASGVPDSADYTVSAQVLNRGGTLGTIGVMGRLADTTLNGYLLQVNAVSAKRLELWKYVGGTATQLGSTTVTITLPAVDSSAPLELEFKGSTVIGRYAGTEYFRLSDTSFSQAGRAGIRGVSSGTATTGLHLNSLTVTHAAPPVVVSDTFSGSIAGQDVTDRFGEIGASWGKMGTGGAGSVALSGTGSVFGTGTSQLLANGAPDSADYTISAQVLNRGGTPGIIGLVGRASGTTMDCYLMRVNALSTSPKLELWRYLANSPTQLGPPTTPIALPAMGASAPLELQFAGSTIIGRYAGTEYFRVTDTAITRIGQVGIRAVSSGTATTGLHLDSLTVTGAAAPTITGLSPAIGGTVGGTSVTITGTDLSGATVTFGGVATTIASNTAMQVVATTPNHAAGAVDVVVTTAGGSATRSGGFTYVAAPVITDVSPTMGFTTGGMSLAISGTNLSGATVNIDGIAAPILVADPMRVTVSTPSHAVGAVDIVVTTAGGSATRSGGYTYVPVPVPAPVITDVSPTMGFTTGGMSLAISGTNLSGATVTIDGIAAPILVADPMRVTVSTPSHAVGAVDIVVTTAGGSATRSGGYTYVPVPVPAPVITDVSPTMGFTTGGMPLAISGSNLGGATVTIDGIAAPILVADPMRVTVSTPSHAVGAVDIVVTTAGGSATRSGGYTYVPVPVPAPVITDVSPTTGFTTGGTPLAISGTNLTGATVTIDGIAASILVSDPTRVTVSTPSHAVGAVDVVVTTAGGSATRSGGFTYVPVPVPAPVIIAVTPSSGLTAGGTSLTITGTDLSGASVTIGGTAAPVTSSSATQLAVTTPSHAVGAVDVVVTTSAGSATRSGGFTYVIAPVITYVTPASGPTAGGTAVTITGSSLDGLTGVTFGGVPASITAQLPLVASDDFNGTTAGANLSGRRSLLGGQWIKDASSNQTGDLVCTSAGRIRNATAAANMYYLPVAPPSAFYEVEAEIYVASLSGAAGVMGRKVANAFTCYTARFDAGTRTWQLWKLIAGAATQIGSSAVPSVTVGGTYRLTLQIRPGGKTVLVDGVPRITSSDDTIPATGFAGLRASAVATETTGLHLDKFSCTSGTPDSVNRIVVTTPPGAAGATDVAVLKGAVAATLPLSFTYIAPPPPTIASVVPSTDLTTGGTQVTIQGTNLSTATVLVGGLAATVSSGSDTTLQVVMPPHAAGSVDVVVSTAGGSTTKVAGFTYVEPVPTITAITPASGPTVGGTAVIITGNDLAGATVTMGGAVATVTASSSTQVLANTPIHAVGAVDVVVTTAGGSATRAGGFTYVAVPAPVITDMSPTIGFTTGGTPLTISGTNLSGATVTIDGIEAPILVSDPMRVTVSTPSHDVGTVDVVLTTAGGSATRSGGYTYVPVPVPVPAPVITDVSPTIGFTTGGTPLAISGTNLSGATVTVDGIEAPILVSDPMRVTVSTPSHDVGTVDVMLTTAGGSATRSGGFTYVAPPVIAPAPVITDLSPWSGFTTGGTSVAINGTDLAGATVTIDGVEAIVLSNEASRVLVSTPSHAVGTVDVVVTTAGGSTSLTGGFTYVAVPVIVPAPVITDVSPSVGFTTGGTSVAINGTDLAGATVTIDGVEATVIMNEASRVLVSMPSHALGTVDLSVTTAGGSTILTGGFTYVEPPVVVPAPVITDVSPAMGFTTGGTSLAINGSDLTDATVTIDGIEAPILVNDPMRVTVSTPSHAVGTVDVVLTTAGGSATLADGFTYVAVPVVVPAPAISAVTPSSGFAAGGTQVAITGSDLMGAIVTVDGVEVTSTAGDATHVLVIMPSHAVGAVDVAVTTAGGSAVSSGGFTYVAAPVISTLTPSAGPATGGVPMTIAGTDLAGATVTIGGEVATVTASDATQVLVTTPSHAAGTVDVVVTTAGGSSTVTGGFTYVAEPVISGLTPTWGSNVGGTVVTISGTDLMGATVLIGGTPAMITASTATQIVANTPSHAAGTVEVVLTTVGGSTTHSGGFTYVVTPVISTVTPSSGLTAGGTSLTITGTDLTGASVTIGGAAAPVTSSSATQLAVTTPSHAVGAVDVVVTTSAGSATRSGGFTYVIAPVITYVTPASGPTAGGTAVTITGSSLDGLTGVTFGGVPGSITAQLPLVASDDFNGTTAGANLSGRRSLLGGQWIKDASSNQTGDLVCTSAGRLRNATAAANMYYLPVAPPSAFYEVEAEIYVASLSGAAGVMGRKVANAFTCYTARFDAGTRTWQLWKLIAGTATQIGSSAVPTVTVGGTYRLTLQIRPGGKTVLVDGVPRITSSDDTIPAAGFAGLRASAVATETTGLHLDKFSCTSGTPDHVNRIVVTTPPGAAGATDVAVLKGAVAATLPLSFTYIAPPPPTIASVVPSTGLTSGGTQVTIQGTNLSTATVLVGGLAATVSSGSDSTLQVVMPPHAAGSVDVVVSTAGGSNTKVAGFTYVEPVPTITAITPASGPTVGGTSVTITGNALTALTSVNFGGVAATVTADLPLLASDDFSGTPTGANLLGRVATLGGAWAKERASSQNGDLVFVADGYVRNYSLTANLYYLPVAPPSSTYDVEADIYVASLIGTAGVIGRKQDTGATCYAACYDAGSGQWQLLKLIDGVATQLGSYPQALTAGQTYRLKLELRSAGKTVYVDGQPRITSGDDEITGAGYAGLRGAGAGGDSIGLHLGRFTSTSATPDPSRRVVVRTPVHVAGAVAVSALTASGSALQPNGFTYVVAPAPVIAAVTPASGPGGTIVTIAGSNLLNAQVTVAGVQAVVNSSNATAIVVTAPSLADGAADIVVTTNTGTASRAGGFLYQNAPRISVQPEDVYALLGQSARCTVMAVGREPLSYQWIRDGVPIPGATAATYTLPVMTTADAGARLTVTVSNTSGTVSATPATLLVASVQPTLVDFADHQVIQRTIGTTSATVAVSGACTGISADTVEARVVPFNGGSDVVPWTMVGSVIGGGFAGSLQVPQGGWYRMDVRVRDALQHVLGQASSTRKWGVGINVLCIGQSNMYGYGNTSYTTADDLVAELRPGASWQHLVDPWLSSGKASCGPALGNALVAALGIPVGLIPSSSLGAPLIGVTGAAYGFRNPDNHADPTTVYGAALRQARTAGGVEFVVFSQGATEAVAISPPTPAAYIDAFQQMRSYYTEDLPSGAAVRWVLSQVGRKLDGGNFDAGYNAIREAHRLLDNGTDVLLAGSTMDFFIADGLTHYGQTGQDAHGRRFARTLLYLLGQRATYGGPRVAAAQFADASRTVIRVGIAHRGGTDFSPAASIPGFVVTDATGTKNVTAARAHGAMIEITCTTPCTGATTLTYLAGKNPAGPAHLWMDNQPDPEPLLPITVPLVIADPGALEITTQPQSITVSEGLTATFTVTASSPLPLAYQWRRNGIAIVGATSATYITPATVASDQGAVYSVVVSDAWGALVSQDAVLTIDVMPPPPGGSS